MSGFLSAIHFEAVNMTYSEFTVGSAYNEQFNAQKCPRRSRVLVTSELFNIVVSEMVQAR